MTEPVACIFPHSDKEFPTPNALPMPPDEGRYLFGEIGWKDKNFKDRVIPGSLVLFSKKGLIIGRAITKTMIRKLEPPEEGETETGEKAIYSHQIFFVSESIKVYRKALSVELIERWADRKHNLHSYRILGTRQDFEKAFPDC